MTTALSENRTHRAISILLVLILHTLLIFALFRFMLSPRNSALRMAEPRLIEWIVHTARLPEPATGKKASKPAPTRAVVQPAPQTSPLAEPTPPTMPMPAPDIRGFGQALVDCAPENLQSSMKRNGRGAGNLARLPPMIPAPWITPITATKYRA